MLASVSQRRVRAPTTFHSVFLEDGGTARYAGQLTRSSSHPLGRCLQTGEGLAASPFLLNKSLQNHLDEKSVFQVENNFVNHTTSLAWRHLASLLLRSSPQRVSAALWAGLHPISPRAELQVSTQPMKRATESTQGLLSAAEHRY